ncbi:MAG: hypothetical protein ACTHMV_05445 [Chitinophagaceae bacterium]
MNNTMRVIYLSILVSLYLPSCLEKPGLKTEVPVQKTFAQDSLPDPAKKDMGAPSSPSFADSISPIPNDSLRLTLKKIKTFEILSVVKHNDSLASTGEDFYVACQKWGLTNKQIEEVFLASEQISGPEWHYLYDVLPCYYEGMVKINDLRLLFSVHSGSYFFVSSRDTSFIYGYMGKKYRKLFMSEPWDGKE